MTVSFESPYYNFRTSKKLNSVAVYNKFLNWLIGANDLNQIDEFEGLKVYYPNGWFTVKNSSQTEEIIDMEIFVTCKSKENGLKIVEKIESTYNHLVEICKN